MYQVHHRTIIYRRMAHLKQGKMSVVEYINTFEKLSFLGDIEEVEEQKMAPFICGLNFGF